MIPLTNEEKRFIINKKFVIYVKKDLVLMMKIKNITARDHCHYTGKYRGTAHDNCNLRYKAPKEILVVFHNGSTYDYHFIIKEFAERFMGQFECFWENTEKCNFSSTNYKLTW